MTANTRLPLACLVLALLVACGGAPVALEGVEDVQILGGDRTLLVGTSTLLTALVVAHGEAATTVTWSSGDETVAEIDDAGLLSAVGIGSTVVTATSTDDTGVSDSITVTVTADPAAAYTVEGTMFVPEGPVPIGVALVLIEYTEGAVMGASSVTPIGEGAYLGPVSPVAPDGTFAAAFPFGDDLPAAVFAPADDFILNAREVDDCTLAPSDGDALVTTAFLEFPLNVPGLVAVTVEGIALAISTDLPIDLEAEEGDIADYGFPTWVYADRPVDVQSAGIGCDTGGSTFDVDVSLAAGWNQLVWRVLVDPVTDAFIGLELRDGGLDAVFTYAVVGF